MAYGKVYLSTVEEYRALRKLGWKLGDPGVTAKVYCHDGWSDSDGWGGDGTRHPVELTNYKGMPRFVLWTVYGERKIVHGITPRGEWEMTLEREQPGERGR
jgi:hypothetical protein